MSQIVNGKQIAQSVAQELTSQDGSWRKKVLGAFMVGGNKISEGFLSQKQKFADTIGVDFRIYRFSEEISNDELRKKIGKIIRGSRFGGGIVQLPLPNKFNEQAILNVIPKEKDVDCLSEQALGGFYTNRWKIAPPSVQAVQRILHETRCDLIDKRVVIIGRGRLIGRPIALWLLDKAQDVSVIYIKDIGHAYLKDADLIIGGAGISGSVQGKYLKKGVGIIDFGYSYKNGMVTGDVDFESCKKKASFITPTPGGTGPIVVGELFYNFYLLNKDTN